MFLDSMVGSSVWCFCLWWMCGCVGFGLVVGLLVLVGMIDVIGFFVIGDFVFFMSGNIMCLVVLLGEGDFGGLVWLSVVLVSFVVGNVLGVILVCFSGCWVVLILVCCVMLLVLLVVWLFDWNVLVLVVVIFVMGMFNVVVEQVNGLFIGLIYVIGVFFCFGCGFGCWLLGEWCNGWWV